MIAVVWLVGALLTGRLLVSGARAALFAVCATIVILAALAGTVGFAHGQTLQYRVQSQSAFQARANTMRSNVMLNRAMLLIRRVN